MGLPSLPRLTDFNEFLTKKYKLEWMDQYPGPFILKVFPLYTELVGRHSPYVTLTLLPFSNSIAFHFTLLLGHFC